MHFFQNWFNWMFSNSSMPWGGGAFPQYHRRYYPCVNPLQGLYAALGRFLGLFKVVWEHGVMMMSPSQDYYSLEALPDYYLNCDSAKRLWQDWRVLRRLFTRRDHSRDLLLQGQSGWLPIHGMVIQRQALIITTDEGETVLDLDERVVWLSRANPANTQIMSEPSGKGLSGTMGWCPV